MPAASVLVSDRGDGTGVLPNHRFGAQTLVTFLGILHFLSLPRPAAFGRHHNYRIPMAGINRFHIVPVLTVQLLKHLRRKVNHHLKSLHLH